MTTDRAAEIAKWPPLIQSLTPREINNLTIILRSALTAAREEGRREEAEAVEDAYERGWKAGAESVATSALTAAREEGRLEGVEAAAKEADALFPGYPGIVSDCIRALADKEPAP